MESAPDGLVVIGDANTSLNPIYAQGMSHGAIGASILDTCLTEQRAAVGTGRVFGLSRRFHTAYSRFLDECWFTSTVEDYGAAASRRAGRTGSRIASWYLKKVVEMAWHDEDVAREFIDVMHMQKSPTTLMRASLLLRAAMPASAELHASIKPVRA